MKDTNVLGTTTVHVFMWFGCGVAYVLSAL